MKDDAGAKTIDLKWFGTLSPKQMFGVLAAFMVALVLTLFGFGVSCYCFGMLIIAVILYMLPRLLGVENLRLMILVGVAFLLSATLIGGLAMAPGFIESNQGNPSDNDYFAGVEYTYTDSGIEVTATLKEDIGPHTVYFEYGEVKGVSFTIANAVFDNKVPMDVTGSSVSGSISLDRDKLYLGHLTMTRTDDSGEEVVNGDSNTYWKFLTGAYDGDFVYMSLFGCFMGTLYIVIIFFMIMIFSQIMRGRMEKTREKMEREGRLYPKGYGRCDKCGATVLPGEVNCRKCGAYIDRPDEMKPRKKDFFECSECGAEVPKDAVKCPKCGAAFDEEEFEVTHADGTTETTKEISECSECGAEVPDKATFCPKCGATFDEDEQ
ncbi:MAG: zinc-ribbon domain-containing protein [Candidatus Methanoplasma sp.]|jgi:ribosomal protein L40E|nr:zinc-ribbon domain-containing protein [Candidatus Methanoplasma sp.]